MKIKTFYDPPGIPMRGADWQAIDDDTYDYDQPVGYGATEQEAIDDLLWKLEEQNDDLRI
jgi:hypothetical protein